MQINLSNINEAKKQAIFDQVVQHARKQRTTARDELGCVYHAVNGNKCFAGALMSDEEAAGLEDELNGKGWYDITQAFNLHLSSRTNDLITQLQRIHDTHSVSSWNEEFGLLARDWDLNYTPEEIKPLPEPVAA